MAANHYPSSLVKVTYTPVDGTETEYTCEDFQPSVNAHLAETTKLGGNENHDVTSLGWSVSVKLQLHRSQAAIVGTLGFTPGSRGTWKLYPDRTNTSKYDSYPVIIENFVRGVAIKQNVMCDISCKARGDDANVSLATI